MKVFGYTTNDFDALILAYLEIIYIFSSHFSNSANYILHILRSIFFSKIAFSLFAQFSIQTTQTLKLVFVLAQVVS